MAVAYDKMRSMMLSGELAPGARVRVRPLVDRLQLSPTPTRTPLAAPHRQGFISAIAIVIVGLLAFAETCKKK